MENYKELTYKILGCCYEVHNVLGSGFFEKVYAEALATEMNSQFIHFEKEKAFNIFYKSENLHLKYLADFLIEGEIILELKAVDKLSSLHVSQCINYLKASDKKLCLLINFGGKSVEIKRIIK